MRKFFILFMILITFSLNVFASVKTDKLIINNVDMTGDTNNALVVGGLNITNGLIKTNNIPLDFCLTVHDSLIVKKEESQIARDFCRQ